MDAGVCRLATGQERNVGGSSGAGSIWHRLSLCATSQLRLILAGEEAVAWQPESYMIHACRRGYRCVCASECMHACSWEWKCTDEASGVSWNQRRDPRIVPNYRVPFRDTPVAWQLPTPITQPFLSHTHFFSLWAPLQVPESSLITFSKLNWRQKDSLWSVEFTLAQSHFQCSSNFFPTLL